MNIKSILCKSSLVFVTLFSLNVGAQVSFPTGTTLVGDIYSTAVTTGGTTPLGDATNSNGIQTSGTIQTYSYTFTAANNGYLQLYFRNDPSYFYVQNVSLTTGGGGNLLANPNFAGSTTLVNGLPIPVGWTSIGSSGLTASGNILTGISGCNSGGNCWVDGAVQGFDGLAQNVIVSGTTYTLRLDMGGYIADNAQAPTYLQDGSSSVEEVLLAIGALPSGISIPSNTPDITPYGDVNGGSGVNLASTILNGVSPNFNNRFDGGTLFVDIGGVFGGNFAITSNGGTIDQNGLYSTFTGIFSDDLTSGPGSLTITNTGPSTGSVTLTGQNTYTGTTTINSGATLALAGSGSIEYSSGVIVNGTFSIDNTTSGASITTLSGNGSVTLGGQNLNITSGGSNGNGSGTFDGVISGAGGSLTIVGGTQILTGSNTYTGATIVNDGATLALSGGGSISHSSALNNSGIFDITAKTGNVALGGTFNQSSTGYLLMNISPTNNQQVSVASNASLAGGLLLNASAGSYSAGRYTLITANGVTGTFGQLITNIGDYTRLGYALSYDANDVYLTLTPNVSDTQQSLVNTASALQSTFTLQNAVLANSFSYDCTVFGANNVCVSAGGRNTTVSADTLNNTSALLIAAYRPHPNYRVGAYADQNLSAVTAASTVKLGSNTPLVGLFAAWNQNQDGTGAEVKVAAALGQKNATVTRQVVATSESGSGSSQLKSQGAQLTAKYGVAVTPEVIVTPYVGIRYTQNNMAGYTEGASAAVTAPLTYSALNTNATTALAGVGASYRFIPQAIAFASVGVESDTNAANGTYSASGIAGLTPINFNANPVKTRPTATLGAYYDVNKTQRVGVTGIYRQEPYQGVSSTTVMATYTVGF